MTNNDESTTALAGTYANAIGESKEADAAYLAYFENSLQGNLKGTATDFLKWAASGVVGKVAGAAIGGPILDLFGLGDKDYTQYLEKIQSQLADMRSEINQGMSALQQGIGEIKTALTAISVDAKDQKMQTALQMYTPNKNKVNQNFVSFANAIAGVPSTDAVISLRSIKTIFDLLQITNMNSISEAMLNIHDQLYGAGQMTGIIELQIDACYSAVVKWASVSSNLTPEYVSVTYGYEDYSKILFEASPVMNEELNRTVLPNLKAMLVVQLQGLALLTRAWQGTEQQPQLQVHTANLKAQILKIRGLHAAMTATAKYDKFVQDTVVAFAKPMPQEVYSQFVEHLDDPSGNVGGGNLRYWRFASPPFGKDWAAWGHPRQFIPNYRRPFHKPWDGEEPTMMSGSRQPCEHTCIIKLPINFGGMNQIIHLGMIYGEKAPLHFYTGVKGEIRQSGTPRRILYDPRTTPIPYPHVYIQPVTGDFAAFTKELESPPV